MKKFWNQMKQKPSLPLGAVLLIVSLIFTIYAYNTSFKASQNIGNEISDVKAQIALLSEAGSSSSENASQLESLTLRQKELSDQQLNKEKPYSYGLTMVFFSVLLVLYGIHSLIHPKQTQKMDVKKLAQAGLLAALCYIGFAFFKIDIPVGPEKTAFHFGNVFCVLAALLLGGFWGGLAGAIGMTIGDLTTSYVTSAPKTFFLKLCIGLIVGFVAHTIFKLSRAHTQKYVTGVTIGACISGMAFNIVADPIVGYFYKTYLLGVPQDLSKALAKISALTTSVNAVVAVIAASLFYLALRPALKKSGLFVQVTPEIEESRKV